MRKGNQKRAITEYNVAYRDGQKAGQASRVQTRIGWDYEGDTANNLNPFLKSGRTDWEYLLRERWDAGFKDGQDERKREIKRVLDEEVKRQVDAAKDALPACKPTPENPLVRIVDGVVYVRPDEYEDWQVYHAPASPAAKVVTTTEVMSRD